MFLRAKRVLWFFVLLCITLNIFGIFVFAEDVPNTEYKTTYLKDIVDTSSPVRDFEIMFDKTTSEILQTYPKDSSFVDSSQIIEAYELGYDTEDYSFYIYVYSPSGIPANELSFSFYVDEEYIPFSTEKISSEHTLSKFKVNLDATFRGKNFVFEPYMREVERNYYINDVYIDNIHYEDAMHHFRFSNIEMESDPIEFVYSSSELILTLDDPKFNSIKFYCEDSRFSKINTLPIEHTNYTDDNYIVSRRGDLSFQIIFSFDGNRIVIPRVVFYSNFPLSGAFINRVTLKTDRDELSEVYVHLSNYHKDDAGIFNFRNTSNSSEKALYYKSSSKNVQKISCGHTGYRLNSSAVGKEFYDTLTSVYFSLPKDMLEMDDFVTYNDRYISFMDYTYNYGWLYPSFVVSIKDNKNAANDLFEHLKAAFENNYYVGSDLHDLMTLDGITISHRTNLLLGDLDAVNESNSILSTDYSLFPNGIQTKNTGFIFSVDGELGKFEYLVDGKTILEAIENEPSQRVTNLTHLDGTLRFDDKFNLLSYNDCSFETLSRDLGSSLSAWFEITFGSGFEVQDSIKDISAIVILDSNDMLDALSMTEEKFSNTYLVNPKDVKDIKEQITSAYLANKVFVFSRFDTYQYFASDLYIGTKSAPEDAYVFYEKLYFDFDILKLGVTNASDTVVYEIDMDPIDIVVGSTSPFPIEKRESDWLAKLLSIIIAVVTIILILIFLPHILKFFGFTVKKVNKTYNSLKANIKSRKRKRKK